MADINYPGNPIQQKIDENYKNTKIYVSVSVDLDNTTYQIAGNSRLFFDGTFKIEKIQFENHGLGYGSETDGKELKLSVDVSKFLVANGSAASDEIAKATCVVKIEAGDTLLDTYTLDDNKESRSVFNFIVNFKII